MLSVTTINVNGLNLQVKTEIFQVDFLNLVYAIYKRPSKMLAHENVQCREIKKVIPGKY